jgi:hypothetical protein
VDVRSKDHNGDLVIATALALWSAVGRLSYRSAGADWCSRGRAVKARARRRSRSPLRHAAPARVPSAESTEAAAAEESIRRDPGSGNGATSAPAQPRPKVARRTPKNKDGLPEG